MGGGDRGVEVGRHGKQRRQQEVERQSNKPSLCECRFEPCGEDMLGMT